ncbi:hypothetical protein [Acinetobacter sp. YH16057]|uniref:hypothetical protein n=1 Tax=Acinetobacter sp. YH16057 TaxID=2601195 RepID=UPI0015D43924|nr:hypothetical protein [Acinetobacter sp. YH16057]
MKKLTVIELCKLTGLTRSQIYYLNKKHNLINLNEKINYEYALPIITTLTIKKAKKANEKNFRQILNMLILQNHALQKQLNLARELEKNYLSELMNYQQSLAQKNTSTPSIDEGNAQLVLKNNIDEKSQNPIQPKSDMYAPKESCYSNDIESESASENGIRPLSIASVHNGPILSDLDKIKSEPSKQKNEVIEKKENAFLSTPPSSQNDGKNPQSPNKRKKVSTLRSTQIPKYISITKRKPNADKQSEQTTENE